ncbi:MAG: hypothetical protein IPF98_17885 [Gemmatimonadetes bacterium]|nr:hypothetical protein [Gemmatimonadota bacterium]
MCGIDDLHAEALVRVPIGPRFEDGHRFDDGVALQRGHGGEDPRVGRLGKGDPCPVLGGSAAQGDDEVVRRPHA